MPPILLSREQIDQRVAALAAEIRATTPTEAASTWSACSRARSSSWPISSRRLDVPATIDFLALSSYAAGTTSTGEVRLLKDLDVALEGRHVIIVEDIVDTGLTLTICRRSCGRAARRRCGPRAC